MRSLGFRPGMKPDDRTSAFLQFKTLPLAQVGYKHHAFCEHLLNESRSSNPQLIQYIYPDLYRVDELSDIGGIEDPADQEIVIPQPPRLQVQMI